MFAGVSDVATGDAHEPWNVRIDAWCLQLIQSTMLRIRTSCLVSSALRERLFHWPANSPIPG